MLENGGDTETEGRQSFACSNFTPGGSDDIFGVHFVGTLRIAAPAQQTLRHVEQKPIFEIDIAFEQGIGQGDFPRATRPSCFPLQRQDSELDRRRI